jgi:hypothetical protein
MNLLLLLLKNPLAIALAVVTLLGAFGTMWYRSQAADAKADLAEVKVQHSEQVALAERARAQAQEEAREIEATWRKKYGELEANGQTKLAVVAADRERIARNNDGLQRTVDLALNSIRAGKAARAPTAPADCTADEDATRVLAELFGRARARANLLAGVADEAHARGQACERADAVGR